jgi:hypothetical protein
VQQEREREERESERESESESERDEMETADGVRLSQGITEMNRRTIFRAQRESAVQSRTGGGSNDY